jgi:Ser-tRNA(Ala) deacylase AlaX
LPVIMEPTRLLYLENHSLFEAVATMLAIEEVDDRRVVILDKTILYPQGGGQPYDTGLIKSGVATFFVEETRFVDGVVKHVGHFEGGSFEVGDKVDCLIDVDRRRLHTRLHSGGHLVDMAMKELGVSWVPGKGYHFPNGPYVEYAGSLEGVDVEKLKSDIENKASEIIKRNDSVTIRFMPKEEMNTVCDNVPDYLPAGKPARVVMYGNFGIPCGGTHVEHLADIGDLTIRKIKKEGKNIKVSYDVTR